MLQQVSEIAAGGGVATLQRSLGVARVAFKRRGADTVLGDVHQSGCCKVRFPRAETGAAPEAVFINTAGGLTDGDRLDSEAVWGRGTSAIVTSQAAERIYKSRAGLAKITNRLSVEPDATALWLPQETILFDRGRFSRRLEADVASSARLLACESTLFGRSAMGERVERGEIIDAWRVRRDGRLVFADGFHLEGDIRSALGRAAIGRGANATASVIYVDECASDYIEALRAVLDGMDSCAGCSAIGPVLVMRMLGQSGDALRRDLVHVLEFFLNRLGEGKTNGTATLPRVWSC